MAGFAAARSRQQAPGQQHVERAEDAERDEDRAPAARDDQRRAEERRDVGPDDDHQAHQREPFRRFRLPCPVARHRTPEDQPGGPAERLEEPHGDQHGNVGADGRREARHRVDGQPDHQHRSTPEAVRHGTVDELPDREAEDVEADRQPNGALARPQVGRGVGERRHEDVHGQRAVEGEERQEPERCPERPGGDAGITDHASSRNGHVATLRNHPARHQCSPGRGRMAAGRAPRRDTTGATSRGGSYARNCRTMLAMTLMTRGSDRLSAWRSLTCSNRMRWASKYWSIARDASAGSLERMPSRMASL